MDGSVHILCPHCDTINRVPRDRAAKDGRCGQCHQALFDAHPVALDTARFERHLAKGDVPLLGRRRRHGARTTISSRASSSCSRY